MSSVEFYVALRVLPLFSQGFPDRVLHDVAQ